jgi:hypothetical protein
MAFGAWSPGVQNRKITKIRYGWAILDENREKVEKIRIFRKIRKNRLNPVKCQIWRLKPRKVR